MLLTEKEARNATCPFLKGYPCRGSECMAWRTVIVKTSEGCCVLMSAAESLDDFCGDLVVNSGQ